jgi:photoactive yellow protein
MTVTVELGFTDDNLLASLDDLTDEELNELEFGAIGIDAGGIVRRYNAAEERVSGVSAPRNIGSSLFTVVAPCMNNFLVAQRFEDAAQKGETLDVIMDYVLTLRMRPTKVQLRLLYAPDARHGYVLIRRSS